MDPQHRSPHVQGQSPWPLAAFVAMLAVFGLVMAGGLGVALVRQQALRAQAAQARELAEQQRAVAEQAMREAQVQRELAERAMEEAKRQRDVAEQAKQQAERQRDVAEQARREAEERREEPEQPVEEAESQPEAAERPMSEAAREPAAGRQPDSQPEPRGPETRSAAVDVTSRWTEVASSKVRYAATRRSAENRSSCRRNPSRSFGWPAKRATAAATPSVSLISFASSSRRR